MPARYYNLAAADATKGTGGIHARRRYLRRYFDADIDDPLLYDLVINTGRLGFARTAELIAQAAIEELRRVSRNAATTDDVTSSDQ